MVFFQNNKKAILEAANVGRTKRRTKQDGSNVQIIYFNHLKEYLLVLHNNVLLEYELSKSYRTTQNVLQLLQIQNRIEEVAPFTM